MNRHKASIIHMCDRIGRWEKDCCRKTKALFIVATFDVLQYFDRFAIKWDVMVCVVLWDFKPGDSL